MKQLLQDYLNRGGERPDPKFQYKIQSYNYDGHIVHIRYDDPLEHGMQYTSLGIWDFLEWAFNKGLLESSKTDIK